MEKHGIIRRIDDLGRIVIPDRSSFTTARPAAAGTASTNVT